MGFLYRGVLVTQYVIDRIAADMDFDTIRLQIARDFDGQDLTKEFFEKIASENEEAIEKRREALLKEIEKTNPVGVVMEAVERLRGISNNSSDPKEITAALATLKGYVEMQTQKLARANRQDQNVFIQQNNYLVLEELARKKLISVPDEKALREFIGVEAESVENEVV